MATTSDLEVGGFSSRPVLALRLNIAYEADSRLGPFCRLVVPGLLPDGPGVYAWVVDESVRYVGKARWLRAVVQGAAVQRACNDYCYVSPSQAAERYDTRVRVNGLLNAAFCQGTTQAWWWRETTSEGAAQEAKRRFVTMWSPPWNRAGGPVPSR